ncbi:MAG: hypothetical protein WHX53_12350 [Anaerolineae bacterium]
MYPLLLTLHSWLRWVVVIVGVIAVVRFAVGWLGRREWQPLDGRLGAVLPMLLDIQLLVGLLLYFFASPITAGALRNFGAAMGNAVLRFYAVEHLLLMVIALVLAHVGNVLIKRRAAGPARFRAATILFGLALLVILMAIPWPFVTTGMNRPWFRLG